jgi:hypothetical protein
LTARTARLAAHTGESMSDEPPYKPAPLPDAVVRARRQSATAEAAARQAVQPELNAALDVARTALAKIASYHAGVADRTDLNLSYEPGSQALALWESSAAALGLTRALADLIGLGYHAQILPTYRAIHELLGVVAVLDDATETEFLVSWLANDEVRQRKVRAAATRQSERIKQLLGAGSDEVVIGDAGAMMKTLYGPLSDISHGRRSAVRTYISETLRAAEIGPHPAAYIRVEHHEVGLLLVEDVVIVVGGALWTLYGGTFFDDRIAPLLDAVHQAAERLGHMRQQLGR